MHQLKCNKTKLAVLGFLVAALNGISSAWAEEATNRQEKSAVGKASRTGTSDCATDTLVVRSRSASNELLDCMEKTEVHRSSSFPDPSYDEIRAYGLAKNGHLEESIKLFQKVLKDPNSRGTREPYKSMLELDLATAYEKQGQHDEALPLLEKANPYYAGNALVRVLVKCKRYDDALKICDRETANSPADRYPSPNYKRCEWLRSRASVYAGMGSYSKAYADFKEAASYYAQDSANNLDQCVMECKALLGTHAQPLNVTAKDLVSEDADTIINLLKFLLQCSKPVTTEDINLVLHTKLKVPGGIFPDCDQSKQPSPSLWEAEYRTTGKAGHDPATALIRFTVWRSRCAIPKETIMHALSRHNPAPGATYGYFSNVPLKEGVTFSSANGKLILDFAQSGFKVLEYAEWKGAKISSSRDPDETKMEQAVSEQDLASALRHASNVISKDPTNAYKYLERSQVYEKLGNLNAAIADAATATKLGGLVHLPRKIALLLKAKMDEDATTELENVICSTKFARERSLFELTLAKIYLKNQNFEKAIAAAGSCIEEENKLNYRANGREPSYMRDFGFEELERMSAPAYVVKAQAEFEMKNYAEAGTDARLAADQYYELGQIEKRDKLLSWIEKHLPKK